MADSFRHLHAAFVVIGFALSQTCAAQQQDTTQSAPVEQALPVIPQDRTTGISSPFQQGTAAEPFGPAGGAGMAGGQQSGAGIPLGPGTVYTGIGTVLKHDDNMYLSNTNKKSSTGTVVSPSVKFETQNRGNIYSLAYRADLANYWDSSADNYSDQQLLANANWSITSRARLRLRAEYLDAHDGRGTTDIPSGAVPNRWHAPSIATGFTYGSIGAMGRIEAESGYQRKRYLNNFANTSASDFDTFFFGGTFFYRVMPKTTLLFQVKQTKFDYTNDTSLLSSTERRYLIGATWEATAKTTVGFRVGQVRKSYGSSSQQGFSAPSWDGEVIWSPLTYSIFRITTSQQTFESTGVGNAILTKSVLGVWTHAWNSRATSNVTLGFRNDNFQGSSPARNDNTKSVGFQLNYQLSRRLHAGAGYTHTERTSSIPTDVYNRNLFMLSLGVTM